MGFKGNTTFEFGQEWWAGLVKEGTEVGRGRSINRSTDVEGTS